MKYANRNGERWIDDSSQDKILKSMYGSLVGRVFVKIAIRPIFSKLGGLFMSSRLSKPLINGFVKKHDIDLQKCKKQTFASYNEFFTRELNAEERPIDKDPNVFISPCDSKLSVFPIEENSMFNIKHTTYSLSSLIRDEDLAQEFIGGYAFIFRLTVDDYHRYCYIDDGDKSKNLFIKGVLHTVNPVANDVYPIYKENCREYSIIQTKKFDKILHMEVGALMVGKISNRQLEPAEVHRGDEKGMFEFGGSTIIVFTKKDVLSIDKDILQNSLDDYETKVRMGEQIATKAL